MRSDVYRYGVTMAILMGTAITAKLVATQPSEPLEEPLDNISMSIKGWAAENDPALRADILASLDPTSYISRTYRRGADSLSLFVAYYANQKAGESMHSPRHCLPGAGWEISNYGVTDLPWRGGTVQINRHTIEKDGVRMAVLYWYHSKRRIIADEYVAKVFLVRDAIVERRTGGALVRIICRDDPETVKAAREFGAAVMPQVQQCMTGRGGAQN